MIPRTDINWPRVMFAALTVYALIGVPAWLAWRYCCAVDDAVARYDRQVK
jgi:hypothetical protein